jgi:ribonuclease HI
MQEYTVVIGTQFEESKCYLLQFDGLAEPNPGKTTGGAVIFTPTTRQLFLERGQLLKYGTNNQGEYLGLLIGLLAAIENNIKHLLIEGDSQLVISQVSGKWKVNEPILKKYHKRVCSLLSKFDFVAIRHVYRDKNKHADALTNEVAQSNESFYKIYSD